jgi:mRNA interferase YafQ
MYSIDYTKAFLRDVKAYYRHGGTEDKLGRVLRLLQKNEPLPAALHDHQLQGKLRKFRELHVEPDWLLVYEKNGKQLSILCIWLSTHKKLEERGRNM